MEVLKFVKKIPLLDRVAVLFSFDGKYSSQQLVFILSIVYLCKLTVFSLGVPVVSLITIFVLFYPVIVAIQKKCCAINQKGSFFILVYSIVFIFESIFSFSTIQNAQKYVNEIKFVQGICYSLILLLLLIPDKKDADLSLRSPLLKYPFVYVGICWTLAIGATLAVNHYLGI